VSVVDKQLDNNVDVQGRQSVDRGKGSPKLGPAGKRGDCQGTLDSTIRCAYKMIGEGSHQAYLLTHTRKGAPDTAGGVQKSNGTNEHS